MADHPLRPATRLSLGRPLPHQLADATQAPPSAPLAELSSPGPESQGTYAVLAVLSDRCPPLKGRLPTCSSPVRRCTQGRSLFLARLACVRPAANVRSEPGSNSPCKVFDLKLLGDFAVLQRIRVLMYRGPLIHSRESWDRAPHRLRTRGDSCRWVTNPTLASTIQFSKTELSSGTVRRRRRPFRRRGRLLIQFLSLIHI